MAASTLLTDAFTTAVAYWRANAGGTRVGLIADLQARLGITQPTAAKWVDAMTQEAFDIAMTDAPDYAGFRARLGAVGPVRALRGAECVFAHLREGALVLDARDEKVAQQNEIMVSVDAKIVTVNQAVSDMTAQPASATRDAVLTSLARYLTTLISRRQGYVDEVARLAAQG